jgi:hypothetical protein
MLAVVFARSMPSMAWAAEPQVTEVRTEIGENRVAYPQISGLEDQAVEQAINDDIIMKAEIPSHLVTLSTLGEGGWGLVVEYEAYVQGNVLSVAVSAKGKMPMGREGHKYTALCYDLTTGEPVTLDRLLTDVDAAAAWMEEKAEITLRDELSGYLENTDLAPMPMDSFTVSEDGMTFYYPAEQFSLLSGFSGACHFYLGEIAEFINWEAFSELTGIAKPEYTDAQAKAQIAALLAKGQLPHVPVKIGDPIVATSETYRLLRVPDRFPGGKYYQMETPMFRQVLLLTDGEPENENTKVTGIQSARGNLCGIQAGVTTRERWREILGEPDNSAAFTEELANDYAIPVGESDFYTFGSYQLRLHADENGVLHSIRLSK